jgi:hypothetical protein
MTTGKGFTIEKSYFDAHTFFFLGDRKSVFIFTYDIKEEEHQNTQRSDLYWGKGSDGVNFPSFKSNSLMLLFLLPTFLT